VQGGFDVREEAKEKRAMKKEKGRNEVRRCLSG